MLGKCGSEATRLVGTHLPGHGPWCASTSTPSLVVRPLKPHQHNRHPSSHAHATTEGSQDGAQAGQRLPTRRGTPASRQYEPADVLSADASSTDQSLSSDNAAAQAVPDDSLFWQPAMAAVPILLPSGTKNLKGVIKKRPQGKRTPKVVKPGARLRRSPDTAALLDFPSFPEPEAATTSPNDSPAISTTPNSPSATTTNKTTVASSQETTPRTPTSSAPAADLNQTDSSVQRTELPAKPTPPATAQPASVVPDAPQTTLQSGPVGLTGVSAPTHPPPETHAPTVTSNAQPPLSPPPATSTAPAQPASPATIPATVTSPVTGPTAPAAAPTRPAPAVGFSVAQQASFRSAYPWLFQGVSKRDITTLETRYHYAHMLRSSRPLLVHYDISDPQHRPAPLEHNPSVIAPSLTVRTLARAEAARRAEVFELPLSAAVASATGTAVASSQPAEPATASSPEQHDAVWTVRLRQQAAYRDYLVELRKVLLSSVGEVGGAQGASGGTGRIRSFPVDAKLAYQAGICEDWLQLSLLLDGFATHLGPAAVSAMYRVLSGLVSRRLMETWGPGERLAFTRFMTDLATTAGRLMRQAAPEHVAWVVYAVAVVEGLLEGRHNDTLQLLPDFYSYGMLVADEPDQATPASSSTAGQTDGSQAPDASQQPSGAGKGKRKGRAALRNAGQSDSAVVAVGSASVGSQPAAQTSTPAAQSGAPGQQQQQQKVVAPEHPSVSRVRATKQLLQLACRRAEGLLRQQPVQPRHEISTPAGPAALPVGVASTPATNTAPSLPDAASTTAASEARPGQPQSAPIPNPPGASPTQSSTTAEAAGTQEQLAGRWTATQYAQLLWGLGNLGHRPGTTLLDLVIKRVQWRLDAFQPTQLWGLLWGLARLSTGPGCPTLDSAWMARYLAACTKHMQTLDSAGLVHLIWSLAVLHTSPYAQAPVPPKEWLRSYCGAVVANLKSFTAPQLVALIESLSVLEYVPRPEVTAALLSQSRRSLHMCSAAHLTTLLRALAELPRWEPGRQFLYDYVFVLSKVTAQLTTAQAAILCWSFARLGYMPVPEVWRALLRRVSGQGFRHASATDLAQTLWACAQLQARETLVGLWVQPALPPTGVTLVPAQGAPDSTTPTDMQAPWTADTAASGSAAGAGFGAPALASQVDGSTHTAESGNDAAGVGSEAGSGGSKGSRSSSDPAGTGSAPVASGGGSESSGDSGSDGSGSSSVRTGSRMTPGIGVGVGGHSPQAAGGQLRQLWLDGWVVSVTRVAEGFTAADIPKTLWAVSELGVLPPAAMLDALLARGRRVMSEMTGCEMCEMLGSLGRLKYRPTDEWLEEFVRQVHPRVSECPGKDLSQLVWALATLGAPVPDTLLKAVCSECARQWSDSSAHTGASLGLLAWGLAQYGYSPFGVQEGFLVETDSGFEDPVAMLLGEDTDGDSATTGANSSPVRGGGRVKPRDAEAEWWQGYFDCVCRHWVSVTGPSLVLMVLGVAGLVKVPPDRQWQEEWLRAAKVTLARPGTSRAVLSTLLTTAGLHSGLTTGSQSSQAEAGSSTRHDAGQSHEEGTGARTHASAGAGLARGRVVIAKRTPVPTLLQAMQQCGVLARDPSVQLLIPERALHSTWLAVLLGELRVRWGFQRR